MQILAVGIGKPKHARRYCGKLAPGATCITSESDQLHRVYGIKEERGLAGAVRTTGAGFRAASKGLRQGKATGNVRMKHATFIVDEAGLIRVAHYAAFIGDQPDIPELLETFQQVAA